MARHSETYELSDAEKRDLITLIQQGKPLPEKYRFLLFADKKEVELVWNGKTRDVCTAVLPFQTLEHVDEPRKENHAQQEIGFDTGGRQVKGWTNKLIWGDNKLILSSLKSGALRQQIEEAGGLKLIYIDPPFDVGADFSMDIEIGDEVFHKEPNILEQIAYRDTWGRGADSFLAMLYERLILMRDLMVPNASIFVHIDWRMNSAVRTIMDEVFGTDNYRNEITWVRSASHNDATAQLGRVKDSILYYSRSSSSPLNIQYVPYSQEYIDAEWRKLPSGRYWKSENMLDPRKQMKSFDFHGTIARWRTGPDKMEEYWNAPQTEVPNSHGRIKLGEDGFPIKRCRIMFLDEMDGVPLSDNWSDISYLAGGSGEAVGYKTQKPEALIERILKCCTVEGDLVADFFMGSGTTAAVAEKTGRKWLASDLGKFGVHTARKRMIQVQRSQKAEGKPFRAFEVLNLGRYERQAYLNVEGRLVGAAKRKALDKKEREFRALILRAYKAKPLDGSGFFHGTNGNRYVAVGPINLPVGRLFVEEVIVECRKLGATRADILAFEFEMGLFPAVLDEAKAKGIELTPKYIPKEVFDKRAVDRGQVVFHDISFIEAAAKRDPKNGRRVRVDLKDFSVYYSQGALDAAVSELKDGKSTVVCENGKLLKITKDKDGEVSKDVLTRKWTDWVDYWAVDFDYHSRKEIIRQRRDRQEAALTLPGSGGGKGKNAVRDGEQGYLIDDLAYDEHWTGGYIFENEWQSFRTRKERELELATAWHDYPAPGHYVVAVKVIDIFGNDTMTLLPVDVS